MLASYIFGKTAAFLLISYPKVKLVSLWNWMSVAKKFLQSFAQVLLISVSELLKLFSLTRPKPAYGRQGLAGSWGQDTDEVSTFLVFLTSHFAPAALSSDLKPTWDDKNPLGIMKTRPGAIKKT